MKKNYTIASHIGLFTALFACLATINTHAKTIRFFNDTANNAKVEFAHFTSWSGVDRSPTLSTLDIPSKEYQDLYIKPYQYASNLYVPNRDWALDAGPKGSEKYKERSEEIFSKYSVEEDDQYYSAQVSFGSEYHVFVKTSDEDIGNLLKELPEDPKGKDGIHINDETINIVVDGSIKKTYKDEE